jgi:hypothetical protein
MRVLLLLVGALLSAFAVLHVFVTYEHYNAPDASTTTVLSPLLLAIAGALMAFLAFRRALSGPRPFRGTGAARPPRGGG